MAEYLFDVFVDIEQKFDVYLTAESPIGSSNTNQFPSILLLDPNAQVYSEITVSNGDLFIDGIRLANQADIANLAGVYHPKQSGWTTINKLYYLSASNTWAPLTIGSGLAFNSGTLSVNVTNYEAGNGLQIVEGTSGPAYAINTSIVVDLNTSQTLANKTLNSPSVTRLTTDRITLDGNISTSAWGTNGVRIRGNPVTITDTTSTGTVATAYTDRFGGNTIAATNAVTFTNYFTAYFAAPFNGPNVTMTNRWALGADSLRVGTSNQLTVSTSGVLSAISPVFTTPNIGSAAGTSLAFGANPASTGEIRLPNAGAIVGRNQANSADIQMVQMMSSNKVLLGPATGGTIQISEVAEANSAGNYFYILNNNFFFSIGSTAATRLYRDGADHIWAMRNGTNPYTQRLYNSYTSGSGTNASNNIIGEWFALEWISNEAWLTTRKGTSGGTARDLVLGRDGSERLRMTSAGIRVIQYTFATVPSASANSGSTIAISDRSNRLATSDGTNWNWAGTTTAIT